MAEKKVEQTNMDLEITKQELTDYIDKTVKKEINDELDKTYKKLIREKNKKIIFRNIVILILLAIIYFLFYLLYSNNYFKKYTQNKVEVKKVEKVNIEKKKEEKENNLDDLKEKYSYLLDNIYINDKSEYLKVFYEGKLTDELKSYITLNTVNFETNDNIIIIDEDTFKESYEKIFNDYKNIDFIYNGNEVKYIEKIKSYMINNKIEKNTTRIKREIIDIKENDNIEITTKEAIYKHDKVYNILTNKEIDEDNYTKITYIFNKDNKLIEIRKVD